MTFRSDMRTNTDDRYVKEVQEIYGNCNQEQLLAGLARCYQRIDDLLNEVGKMQADEREQQANKRG